MIFGRGLLACIILLLCCADIVHAQDSLTVRLRDDADNSPIVNATVKLYTDQGDLYADKTSDENGVVGFGFDVSSVDNAVRYTTLLGNPYPNPFTSQTTIPISLSESANISGTVYDMLGREVVSTHSSLEVGAHEFVVRLGALPAGSYLFRLSSDGVEIGTVMMRWVQSNAGTNPTIDLHAGNSGVVKADKALPGTYSLEVTHPSYRPASLENILVDGRTVRVVQMRKVEPVAEFGTDETRKLTVIATAADGLRVPRDLEFHPLRPNELWTVNRSFDGTVVFYDAGSETMIADRRTDFYGNHFMEEVSAIAFSENDFFGTAQESNNTYNNQAAGNNFMGPALWTADTSIYARVYQAPNGLLGSHMDMLHESPYGMGMAHHSGNAYWYADGYYGNIVYYDFQEDHGPGEDDHSDGIVRRYVEATITRFPGVPGHLILDKESGWLYICDPGNSRITRLNTNSGRVTASLWGDPSQLENLAEYSQMGGATYEVFADEDLSRPSGIALHNNKLFVSDYQTGEIIAYSLDGTELNRIQTNAEGVMGLTMGPDGKIWYVDGDADQVVRIDP